MNQEITISHSIIGFLQNNYPNDFEVTDAQKILPIIKENKIIVDRNMTHYNNLFQATKTIENEQVRGEIRKILKYWFESIFVKIETDYSSEEGLALSSMDKILFIPDYTSKQINKIKNRNNGLDVHNEVNFVSPEIYDRLKHSKCTLVFEKGVVYDIKQIFEPYLRNTNTLIIEDPYLPNPKAIHNLKALLSVFKGSEILIKTYSKHHYGKHIKDQENNFTKLEQLINSLMKNEIKVKHLFYDQGKHKERYIYTDKVKINVPGGLDFIDEDGKTVNNANSVEVLVSKRECQE